MFGKHENHSSLLCRQRIECKSFFYWKISSVAEENENFMFAIAGKAIPVFLRVPRQFWFSRKFKSVENRVRNRIFHSVHDCLKKVFSKRSLELAALSYLSICTDQYTFLVTGKKVRFPLAQDRSVPPRMSLPAFSVVESLV